MSIAELSSKAQELMELRRMREELENEITAIEDEIKATMGEQETVIAGPFKLTYKVIASSRLDTGAMKKAIPEICAQYMKTTTVRRFTIN